MKINAKSITLLLVIVNSLMFSQTIPDCLGSITSQTQTQTQNAACFGNMDAEVSAYTVNANSPMIFYNVSFHFIMHPSQATTFSSAFSQALLVNDVNLTVDSINARFQRCGNISSYITPPNPSPLVADSKIRILNAGVYVHTDASVSLNGTPSTSFTTLFSQGTATSMCIYFYWDANTQGYAYYSGSTHFIGVSTYNEFHTPGTEIKTDLLWHELGHALAGLADHYYTDSGSHFGTYEKANNIYYAGDPFPSSAVYLPDDSSVDPAVSTSCDSLAPNAQNNVMGGTTCRQYLSARQIAAFHYYVAKGITSTLTANFNPNIAPYQSYSYYPSAFIPTITANINIVGTQTLSNSFLFDNIVIKTGSNITFSNVVLYAKGNSSRITVEKGAKLVLICSEIKPGGNSVEWQGIEVDGNPYVNQYIPGYQGVLEIYKSRITRAIKGVLVGRTSYGVNIPYTGGGWVIAENSEFQECKTSIEMLPTIMSPYNNKTIFTRCFFTHDNSKRVALGDPQIIGAKLDGVKGVQFIGCSFDPKIEPTKNYYSPKHYGIKAFNSQIIVKPDLFSNSTSFSNFDYGIYMTGYGSLVLEGAYFDTRNGVFLEAINSARIIGNQFKMNTMPPLNYNILNTGLYLSSFTNFKVENNTFECTYSTYTASTEGIVVDNTGPFSTAIYNNQFTKLNMGIWCQDQNYDPTTNNGLQINCNDFKNCNYAIGVQTTDQVTGWFTGIQKTQGISGGSDYYNVRNTYTTTIYKYWNDYIPYNVYPPVVDHGTFVDAKFRIGPQPLFSLSNHVADLHSNLNPPPNREDYCVNTSANRPLNILSSQLTAVNNNLQDLNQTYYSLLDGGSTKTILGSIADLNTSEDELFNIISINSPYLSDTVLKAYFVRPNVSESNLVACFESNAPVGENVWEFISNLNLGIQTDLENHQYPYRLSTRAQKEAEISLVKNAHSYAIGEKINCLMGLDSLENLKDSIALLIELNNQGDINKQLIDLDLAFSDYSSATNRLNTYPLNGEAQRVKYKSYKELYIDIMTSADEKYLLLSDSVKLSAVNEIANDLEHPCIKDAQDLLSAVFDSYFQEEKLMPGQGGAGRAAGNSIQNYPSINGDKMLQQGPQKKKLFADLSPNIAYPANSLSIYPNPASNFIIVSNIGEKRYIMKITNVNGQVLSENSINASSRNTIDTEALLNGIYFVNLYEGNNLVKASKLVIVR